MAFPSADVRTSQEGASARYVLAGDPGARATHLISIMSVKGAQFQSWSTVKQNFGAVMEGRDFSSMFGILRTLAREDFAKGEWEKAIR